MVEAGQGHLPKLIAFDLDGTLWEPEMYQLNGGAPFRRDKTGAVYDSAGERIRLIGASEAIMRELATDERWSEALVAYVSRTEYPEWAVPCLKAFTVAEGKSLHDVGAHFEIYPGSKKTHFKRIHERSGIAYNQMLFFDNERWNCTECSHLGIHCVYTPQGMTDKAWREGLARYAEAAALHSR